MDPVQINPADGRPPFQQIAAQLREAIRKGDLAPGAKLPSISDITAETGVAYATVRQAFNVLRGEGLVDTRAGRGVFVRQPRTPILWSNLQLISEKLAVRSSPEERQKNGPLEARTGISLDKANLISKYTRVTNGADGTDVPEFPAGTPLLQRNYEHRSREDDSLLMWSVGWIPVALIESDPRLLDEDKEPWEGGTHDQLAQVDIEVGRITHTITSRPPTPEEVQQWVMRPSDPMFVMTGIWEDITGRIVTVGRSHYPSDRTSLQFVTDLPRWS